MLILTVITALLAGGTLWAAIVYGRRNAKLAHESNQLARERSVVKWQAGRWDKANAGRLYVANVGEDTAHTVTVVAWDGHDTVTREADRVPPYRPDDDTSSEPPCYLDFLLEHRAANGPDPTRAEKEFKPVMPPEGSRFQEEFQEVLATVRGERRPRGAQSGHRTHHMAIRAGAVVHRDANHWMNAHALAVRCVRRPSAVELTTAFIGQQNQPSDQRALNTLNTACGCKHPRRFVSVDKVTTF